MSTGSADRDGTRRRFDEIASSYDDGFTRSIDRYHEMHEVLVDLVRRLAPEASRILDLGVGTGRLSGLLLEGLPGTRVHGVDFSVEMLGQAHKKLEAHQERFTSQVADLASFDPATAGAWDVIVSALAIHHIDDAHKCSLAQRVRSGLRPGGAFINGDLVRGETALEQELLEAFHVDSLRARGLGEEEIQDRLRRHRQHDIPATVRDQTGWLAGAGFGQIWVPWRHFNQAITVGLLRAPAPE